MTGEPVSEASAGWSRHNVADVGIALIGFGLAVFAVVWFMNLAVQALSVLLPGLEQNSNKPQLLLACGNAFFWLFLGLWLIAHHRKISTRLFRAAAGVPAAERRAALALGIKVYAVYMAALAASWLVLAAFERNGASCQAGRQPRSGDAFVYDVALPDAPSRNRGLPLLSEAPRMARLICVSGRRTR